MGERSMDDIEESFFSLDLPVYHFLRHVNDLKQPRIVLERLDLQMNKFEFVAVAFCNSKHLVFEE